ncbi:hypothetical protein Clacol_007607 [Clathrus columnatus]|uniref:Uncharacterized protein n=1 Tax=Clathrus columnatus TaxID=1419009 RepID=A0AAV5AKF8_9AGAM|nr:hypothetical protein Clacol_007607 [Clathrus columnatus]
MAFSDFESTSSARPDKQLVVKCTFDQRMKRITFASSRNCSYELLCAKIEQCFALSATPFIIRYKDDDGEITDVTSDGDLTEAIHYFHTGDDLPIPSNFSVMSGRSGGSRRVTLRLNIIVENELSLSDTASMISVDEFHHDTSDSLSGHELSFNGHLHDLEDDAVTVSSRDTGSHKLMLNPMTVLRPLSPLTDDSYSPSSIAVSSAKSSSQIKSGDGTSSSGRPLRNESSSGEGSRTLYPSKTSVSPPDVFDRLKQLELSEQNDNGEAKRLSRTSLGAQWLRDQNVRTIMFGGLTEPSISDESEYIAEPDLTGDLNGDLALRQGGHGKYYYEYTSSGASHAAHDEADVVSIAESSLGEMASHQGEPSPHSLSWIADQRANATAKANASANAHANANPKTPNGPISVPNPFSDGEALGVDDTSRHFYIDSDIPPEVLQFIPEHRFPLLPPDQVTNCSSCGVILDSFRYVCTTCGELEPHPRDEIGLTGSSDKGKGRDAPHIHVHHTHIHHTHEGMAYPLITKSKSNASSPSSSSWTLLESVPPRKESLAERPLPNLPVNSNGTAYLRSLFHSSSQDTLFIPPSESRRKPPGYELCSSCIESVGVFHSIEGSTGNSPMNSSPSSSSQESLQTLSQFRRTAPRSKGHVRHAYREKVWGRNGWKDVEHDHDWKCSICSTSSGKRYRCAMCDKFDLCRACYSQVHEIHPSHPFLSVPDQLSSIQGEADNEIPRRSLDMSGEPSMLHPGVKCHHCLLDIVGARFHCALCDSVDICSNCESAGLPGNLTSPDGGHDSSHIMIKIPYPLASTEVETASRRAISLWHGRDRPGLRNRARSASPESSYARTVIGTRMNGISHTQRDRNDHSLPCSDCGRWVQDINAHLVLHIQDLIVSYNVPAGFIQGRGIDPNIPPTAYSQSLYHPHAVCDRCVERIQGTWFHCAYCGGDLCEECEGQGPGAHDPNHVFLVFKSTVNMTQLREIRDLENPSQGPPLIPHPVYN